MRWKYETNVSDPVHQSRRLLALEDPNGFQEPMTTDMRKFSRPAHTVGHPPGTLKPKSNSLAQGVRVKRTTYGESSLDEKAFDRMEDCFAHEAHDLCT